MTNEEGASVSRVPLVSAGIDEVPALVRVVRRLTVARSIEEVMATVTQPARALLRAGGVTFVLRDGDLCYYAEEDAISPLWKGSRFPLDACISGWCMKEGRPAVISDIYKDPRIPHDAYRPTCVRSLAMIPVPVDEPIAAMGAYWPTMRTASNEEVSLLQTIGNAAALAIANVQYRRELNRRKQERDELVHRNKNLFAVIHGLVNLTPGENLAEYREALHGRLNALRQAHALLRSDTGTVEMGALVRALLLPLVPEGGERLDAAGQNIILPERCATALALIVQELGTNAMKYGSLSAPAGRVIVRWEPRDAQVCVTWTESGGPPVTPPSRQGFGTRLMRALASRQLRGRLDLNYDPAGLCCKLLFSVKEAVPSPNSES